MLHAAYEGESVTGLPAEASGSMRPLAAENRDRYRGYAPGSSPEYLGTYLNVTGSILQRRSPKCFLIREKS